MPPVPDAETGTEGSPLPRCGTNQFGEDRERDSPFRRRGPLLLAVCVGTLAIVVGLTASGATAHHRTGHPLPSSCRPQHVADTYDPTPAPPLSPLGAPAADRTCDAPVPDRIPDPTPEPAPGYVPPKKASS